MIAARSVALLCLLLVFGSASGCVLFRRLLLSKAVLRSTRLLSHADDVDSTKSCGDLCLRETKCSAVYFQRQTRRCDLLTSRIDLEGPAALAHAVGHFEVWAVVGRGFGECPVEYRMAWRSSRYFLSTEILPWRMANMLCRMNGSKLAEMTSFEEMEAIRLRMLPEEYLYVRYSVRVGGYQMKGAQSLLEGWRWQYSGLPLEKSTWGRGEPNDLPRKGYMQTVRGNFGGNSVKFHDMHEMKLSPFLCECHLLPSNFDKVERRQPSIETHPPITSMLNFPQ